MIVYFDEKNTHTPIFYVLKAFKGVFIVGLILLVNFVISTKKIVFKNNLLTLILKLIIALLIFFVSLLLINKFLNDDYLSLLNLDYIIIVFIVYLLYYVGREIKLIG